VKYIWLIIVSSIKRIAEESRNIPHIVADVIASGRGNRRQIEKQNIKKNKLNGILIHNKSNRAQFFKRKTPTPLTRYRSGIMMRKK